MSNGVTKPLYLAPTVKCDGWCGGVGVQYIGRKGYAYCAPCRSIRSRGGQEATRPLRKWEAEAMERGERLHRY